MEIDLPGRFRADAHKGDYRMALYEHTVMTRQDISAQQAEALNDTIKDLIVAGGGSVAKIEYWGLRNLTYRVKKNRKAHYSLLAVDAPPAAMADLTRRIKVAGGNIDRILRLARYPVTALRLEVSGADPDVLQADLAAAAFEHGVDVAVEERGILRHAQRLVVMDVDSTLIQGEVIEMLAEHAGCAEEVAAVTEAAMRGEIDFEESLRRRVARLEGVPASALDDVMIVAIESGPNHIMAVAADGTIYTWGANSDGRLGYPTDGLTVTPRAVDLGGDTAPYLLAATPADNARGITAD